jgi:hypothetical protein
MHINRIPFPDQFVPVSTKKCKRTKNSLTSREANIVNPTGTVLFWMRSDSFWRSTSFSHLLGMLLIPHFGRMTRIYNGDKYGCASLTSKLLQKIRCSVYVMQRSKICLGVSSLFLVPCNSVLGPAIKIKSKRIYHVLVDTGRCPSMPTSEQDSTAKEIVLISTNRVSLRNPTSAENRCA